MFTFLSNLLTLACFGLLSYDVKDDDVAFLLYTTKNTKSPISINITNFDMLDMNQEFKIITHGFTENTQSHFYLDLKDAYLKRGTYNVILLDWRNPAIRGLPANNIDAVAEITTKRILNYGIPIKKIHLLGHSLGAHMCGLVGKKIMKAKNGEKIARITGLDAAGSTFEIASKDKMLYKTDADFVDGIHTDGGFFGIIRSYGHADFYVNGGSGPQPGCVFVPFPQISTDIFQAMKPVYDLVTCSHQRSIELYTESVNSNNFIATECGLNLSYKLGMCSNHKTVVMGENTPRDARGVFQISTNGESPFAKQS